MSFRKILFGAVACVAASGAANAATPGWYLSLEGGANWIDDWSALVSKGQIANVQFDTGWAVLGSVGYAFTQNWRTEVEFGYRDNNISAVQADLSWTDGRLWEASVMGNVIYDIHVTDKVGLSLGAGAGADYASLTDRRSSIDLTDQDWNFAYQGIVGLNYAIGSRTTAFVDYRYFRVANPNFDMTSQGGYLIEGDDFVKHTVTAGLRYALGAPAAPMEAPPTAPQAPAVEPGPSRQFIVFFGFNKYNLTSAALRVIAEAVVAAKENGSATLVITGHTDTMGSPDFNQKLSMRRSNAVKAEMVRQGVAAANITTTGKGESELLVQTGDNVKEPQNRRATIDMN